MEQTNQNRMLGEEKISKLLIKFSIPCILSLLISALYNIVDQIFVGNSELGYLGNAATGIVFPILIIAQAFAWCIGDGSAAYLSICQGKKDTQNSHRCIGTGITITLILSVIMLALCAVWKEPLLRLFGASDQTIGMAMEYFTIVLCFFPAFMLMNMMNAVIRADGSPAVSMASMSLGAILNIILDPIFIFALNWGIAGAAWATVIGQTFSFLVSVLYFFRTKSFRLTKDSFVPHFKIFSNALKLGASSFITQMSIVVISLVCNIMLAKYGALSIYGQDIPISVISIETKVFTIVINIVVGIVLGGQPILGYNYGAGKYKRVKETYRTILIATLAVGIVSTLIFEICPQAVIHIFGSGNDTLYLEYARRTFRIFLSLVIFTCVIKMSSIFFQAVGKPVMAVIASLTRDIVCFVPLVILIPSIYERNQAGSGVNGILFAAPAADIIGMIVAVCLTIHYFKTMESNKNPEPVQENAVIRPSHKGVIITIAREHGSCGKRIAQLAAERMGIACYYKEITALAAQEIGLDRHFVSDINENSPEFLRSLYLSTSVVQQAIVAQEQIIRKIADFGSCVIVGRAADYVLSDYPDVVRIFIYAPKEYRVKKVMEMYGDTEEAGRKSIAQSDAARSAYYNSISGGEWGNPHGYHLCIDSSCGVDAAVNIICDYIKLRD
ncbi:MATE family efflux transporter [Lachnoclostridium pacaense]|uniref:MATE family efflux transporter n=1 Tax=Enterocloster hominis (ex Hitch et al. 2024) TaxID=1917870 RepID=A0ABV1D8G7_9FIRM|nr:MATE family efflux transporter [Lachnoclostridium pacaense]MCC2817167.1 MATE family efflux transporter [Lachnoclostridium pacaense]